MVAIERPHKSGKHSYPYVKKSFKTPRGRIPIDPEIVAAIGHRFIATTTTSYKLPVIGEFRGGAYCPIFTRVVITLKILFCIFSQTCGSI